MLNHRTTASSASGVAEVTAFPQSEEKKIQVLCKSISVGTGTVTITVKPGSDTTYRSIVDGTIDLTAPIALLIEGDISAVKATSSSSSDVFVLEVVS